MTRVVIDASVAVKWFIPEELSAESRQLLATRYELLAPDLIWAELGNVLWRKHRRRELDGRTWSRLLRDFSRVPVKFHASEHWVEGALGLAIRYGVTVYDGLYLALAVGTGCRLVTADQGLHRTCQGGALSRVLSWVRDVR